MKTINFFAVATLMLCGFMTDAQTTVGFTYDGAGNRLKRLIIIPKSSETNMDSIPAATPLTENLDELKVKIYPNPTQGRLSVEILNMQIGDYKEITFYDLDGKRIQYCRVLETTNDFDLSNYPIGMYILHINVGQKVSEWKIIKQ